MQGKEGEKSFRPPESNIEREDIENVFFRVHTNQEGFRGTMSSFFPDNPTFTVLDTFAIPKEIVENKKKFLTWFEPRFFSLIDKDDKEKPQALERFSGRLKKALEVLDELPFLLAPKIGQGTSISKKVRRKIKNGFHSVESIMEFFNKVALENSQENLEKFLSPDRESFRGAERFSTCRILTMAYVLEHIETSQNMKSFLSHARYVLGLNRYERDEPGLLSGLRIPKDVKVLLTSNEDVDILKWIGRYQTIEDCKLEHIGKQNDKRDYTIPRVDVGVKGGVRMLLKLLRDPAFEFSPMHDFFRLRFIFENDTSLDQILNLIYDLQEEAKQKELYDIDFEVKEKNYIPLEKIEKLFPQELESNFRSGFFDRIKIDKGYHPDYRNISLKIAFRRKPDEPIFFSFEIQIMKEQELIENESLRLPSNHVVMELKQLVQALTRLNGKMSRESLILHLQYYLEQQMKSRQMPEFLIGKYKEGDNQDQDQDKNFILNFSGNLEEQAENLFELMLKDGTLKEVSKGFFKVE